MEKEAHSNSSNLTNQKYTKREGALHTESVHHFNLVSCGCQDKDRLQPFLHPVPHDFPQTKMRWRLFLKKTFTLPRPKTLEKNDGQILKTRSSILHCTAASDAGLNSMWLLPALLLLAAPPCST